MSAVTEAIAALPFTKSKLGVPIRLWSVQATSDWAADNQTGRNYAESLISCMAEHDLPSLLAEVVKAMRQDGNPWTGIEVGFFHHISECLT